jgi:HK97 family phage major capsid protein
MERRRVLLAEKTRLLNERATKHAQATALAARADNLAPADVVTLEALVAEIKGIDQRLRVVEAELEITPEGDTTGGGDRGNNPPAPNANPAPQGGQGAQGGQRANPPAGGTNDLPPPPTVPGGATQRATNSPAFAGGAPAYSRDLDDKRFFKQQDLCLRGWALAKTNMVTDEIRQAAGDQHFNLFADSIRVRMMDDPKAELRAARENRAQSTSGTAGGYLVATELVQKLEEQLAFIAPIRDHCQIYRSEQGNPVDFPTNDDTGNVGEMISENAAHNEQDATFGKKSLTAYQFSSKIVRVSNQLARDSSFNLQSYLGGALGRRIARAELPYYTTGTGTSQPEGVVTGSSAGVTAASATAIAVDDLLGLLHSLDRAYRDGAKFMMHDLILLAIRKLKDSTNQPIFTQSYIDGEPDRLFGKPIIINNSMASTIATTNKTVLFGDFSHFLIRDVKEVEILRSTERYFEYNQQAFLGVHHSDSKCLSSAAIKRLTQA